jgi:hypothetical protein
MNNQKLFDLVLTTVQAQIRLSAEMTQTSITPSMIESELAAYEADKKKVFELIDRDALVDELIRRSSRTVGENATLSSGEDHIAWLDA